MKKVMAFCCVKRIHILFYFFPLFACSGDIKTEFIWVRTQDHQTTSLEKWKSDEMGVLTSLLSFQRNDNSKTCPINALMSTRHDFEIISQAFDLASKGEFEYLSSEDLYSLITIAAELEAIGILMLCAPNNENYWEPFFVNSFNKIKKYCNRIEYYSLGKSPISNVNALSCCDGRMLFIHGKGSCHASISKSEDSVAILDIDTHAVLHYLKSDEVSFSDIALSNDGSKAVSVYIDNENRSCMVITDISNGKDKHIVIDDCIVGSECLRRPINVIIFNPLRKNEFFVECFGYIGKLVLHENDIDQENVTAEQIRLLYQLYLSVMSGHKIRLNKDGHMYYVYESLAPNMKKVVCEELGVQIS